MMKKYAITVKNLTIKYKPIAKFNLKKFSFTKSIKTKTAIDNISFKIEKGSSYGILGKNGSGKSTLLRALAGIYSIENGSINLHNQSISLLSLGIGFKSYLTGYENILLSGMLMGFDKKIIIDKIDEIIAFADIGEYIYEPVRTYSSGMYSRLSFAITVILESDIILIDEILSVGDAFFKEKSKNKIKELTKNNNKTIIIVSHDFQTLRELTNKTIWLENGKIKEINETNKIIENYKTYYK